MLNKFTTDKIKDLMVRAFGNGIQLKKCKQYMMYLHWKLNIYNKDMENPKVKSSKMQQNL